jgi:hypothetical protein
VSDLQADGQYLGLVQQRRRHELWQRTDLLQQCDFLWSLGLSGRHLHSASGDGLPIDRL